MYFMKTLILHGSPRKKGVTSQLLNHFSEQLKNQHDLENIHIHDEDIKPCTGCLKCRPDKTCALPHDVAHKIARKIDQADLLIIGVPTYWGNMPGPLKTLFDRCVPTFEYIDGMTIRKNQKGTRAILITASSAPFPINQLPGLSRGAIKSVKNILNPGGVKIIKIINIANAAKFDDKKKKFFTKINKFVNKKKI